VIEDFWIVNDDVELKAALVQNYVDAGTPPVVYDSAAVEGFTPQPNTPSNRTAHRAELWLGTSFLQRHFMRKLCI